MLTASISSVDVCVDCCCLCLLLLLLSVAACQFCFTPETRAERFSIVESCTANRIK